jgi:preprotein translocase SecE subunit
MAYKKDQGRMARMAAFWTLAVLVFYGCSSLRDLLTSQFPTSLGEPLAGRVPVLGMELSPALMISAAVLAVALFLLYRWEETPKNADLLIETEQELRKVAWPTLDEAINGSWSVVLTVLFLMGFLFFSDLLLTGLANVVLRGGWSG